MYFNRNTEVRLMEIIIHQAVASYEPWLMRFGASYWSSNERLSPGKISLHLPDFWPRAEKITDGSLPEWLQKDYTLEELKRKIDRSAPAALQEIGRPNEDDFETRLMNHGAMRVYVIEGLRLHLMAAAAFSTSQKKNHEVTGEAVKEVAKWKCWAWPWC